ncbi:MAG: CapA family protein [Dorea sp.]|nr:CapA family protein [Dorea sp.]
MLAEAAVLFVLLMICFGISVHQRGEERKKSAAKKTLVKEALQECYKSALKAGKKEQADFAGWIVENYPKETEGPLYDKAEVGQITEEDIYHVFGETLHVLLDRKAGYLKDDKTKKKHQIYERTGKAEDEAEILIAGDLCFAEEGFVLDYYDEVGEISKCISPELLDMMNKTDLFYLNHEYCVSDRGEPLNGKLYTFRADPKRMKLLNEMGTGLVSLANNHVYDFGEDAMLDTMDYLKEEGIPYVGGGRNKKEAKRPVYFIINGIKIGFVAASNAEITLYTPAAEKDSPGILEAYDTEEYNQVIEDAAKECDYLIAYIHWGNEDTNQYTSTQTEQGTEFLDSGADIVVGGHPHVLQGIEFVDGRPVIYSMGDFWFNNETKYTGLLKLSVAYEGLKEMSFVPCLQTEYTTQYLKEAEKQREMFDFLENLSPNAVIDDKGVITENFEAEVQ